MRPGPLDMRMDPVDTELTAADIVNWYSSKQLENIFIENGETFAARMASEICKYRSHKLIQTTTELAEIAWKSIPAKIAWKAKKVHPATKMFQALRITVNDELNQIKEGLKIAFDRLHDGGLLIAVSFHALEDTVVKEFFRPCSLCKP